MEQNIIDAILTLLGVATTGFIGIAVRAVVKFIASKNLEFLAKQAVHFAEDAYQEYDGQEKFSQACKWLAKQLDQWKLTRNIDNDDIKKFVSSAYNQVKKELKDARL